MATRYVEENEKSVYIGYCPIDGDCPARVGEATEEEVTAHLRSHVFYEWGKSGISGKSGKSGKSGQGMTVAQIVTEADLLYKEAQAKGVPRASTPVLGFDAVAV